tara:strand:+ start:545 stop:880 length:336 start_codon:yes stop_codon:yes gene_type:complete
MSKQKPKRPTTRQLKNDITVIVKEILNLKKYVNDVLTTSTISNRHLIEQYVEYKGDINNLIEYMEKEINNEERTINESSEDGEKKQAKGSGTTKDVSKDVKGIGARSVQQG